MGKQNDERPSVDDGEEKVGLKANLNLFGGVMLGVGCIIGSGIFVSTKGVHENAGSVGLSLIIWLLCGVFSALGAYCYAELGTLITQSGGDYAYVYVAFGKFMAFVRLWIECIIIRQDQTCLLPCTLAAVAIIFAQYVLQPFFSCSSPGFALQAAAACCLVTLSLVNAFSSRLTTMIQNVFTIGKLAALALIILTGFYLLATKESSELEAFSNIFDGPPVTFGKLSIAFYAGLWSFNGWNYITIVTEELKNPTRNLPLSIGLSCLICTVVYTLANLAFYAGVSLTEIVESEAVAVTFAEHHYGFLAPIMPLCVAMSCFGTVNGVLLTSSRLFYVGARENQMPNILSMINPYTGTPMPSVFFIMILSMGYLTMSDNIYSLINSIQIVNWIAVAMAVAGLLYLRIKMPVKDHPRPVKVNLIVPVIFLTGCVFLIAVPIYQEFKDSMVGLALLLTSLPVYYLFIHRKNSSSIDNAMGKFTQACQKIMLVVGEDKLK
uniref:Uncharacterized protein n=1 Tax=Romanomermis culicivorax TaxID=13658 RepID=A0A915L5E6_ROMCU